MLCYVAISWLGYATAHDTPKAAPTAANIADARFHKNFIILDLFSWVIFPQILSTDYHRLIIQFSILTDFIHRFSLIENYFGFTQILAAQEKSVLIHDKS